MFPTCEIIFYIRTMQIGAIEMQNGSPIDMFIHKLNI